MLPQSFNLDKYPNYQQVVFLSGSVFISEVLSAPFERVKVLLQTKQSGPIKSFLHRREVNAVIRSIAQKEGLANLYHGFKPLLDREMFLNVTKFYIYYIGMDHIFKNKSHEFFYPHVLASCVLGTSVATFFSQASDIKRLRIQAEGIGEEKVKKIDPIVKWRKVLHSKNRPKVILPGVGVNLIVQNVQALLELTTFFALRNSIKQSRVIESDYAVNGISVITASAVGTLVSAPLDLIYANIVFRKINEKDSSFMKCASDLIKQEGVKGLYKSYIPYFYKTVVFNLSMITLLQTFCSTFQAP